MGKRLASKQLTSQNFDQSESEDGEEGGQATNQELAGRRIIKVVRHSAKDSQLIEEPQKESKGFKLICSLGPTTSAKPKEQAAAPLFKFQAPAAGASQVEFAGVKVKPQASDAQKTENGSSQLFKAPSDSQKVTFGGQEVPSQTQKTESKDVKESVSSGNLFSSSFNAPPPQPAADKPKEETPAPAATTAFGSGSGLFGAAAQQPAPSNIFAQPSGGSNSGGLFSSGSLFGAQADKPKEGGLFGGSQDKPKEGNLFSKPEDAKPSGGLFSTSTDNNKPSTNLFGASKPEGGNLFGDSKPLFGAAPSQPAPAGGLFGGPPAGGAGGLFGSTGNASLFNTTFDQNKESAFKPSMFDKPKGEEDDDDDDGNVKAEPEEPIYAEASKVEFKKGVEIQKSPYTKVFEQKVSKFKIAVPKEHKKSLDMGTLSLEWIEQNGKKSYILVFRTIRPLYIANLVHTSKVRRVEEKAHKNQLKCAQVWTDPTTQKKVMSFVQINFSKHEDLEAFEKEYKLAVELAQKAQTTA